MANFCPCLFSHKGRKIAHFNQKMCRKFVFSFEFSLALPLFCLNLQSPNVFENTNFEPLKKINVYPLIRACKLEYMPWINKRDYTFIRNTRVLGGRGEKGPSFSGMSGPKTHRNAVIELYLHIYALF